MPPFRILKRLRQLFSQQKAKTGKTQRSLRLVQLEDRRMLNGAFAIVANSGNPILNLTGIAGTSDVAISAATIDNGLGTNVDAVKITLTGDSWDGVDQTKIDVNGNELTVALDLFNNLNFSSGHDFTQTVALDIQNLTITNAASVTFTTAANDFNSVSIQRFRRSPRERSVCLRTVGPMVIWFSMTS